MAAHTMVKILLLLGLAAVLVQSQQTSRLRMKHPCPAPFEVTIKQKLNALPNRLRGLCETRGEGRDTCRRRMSCCENSQGDMICVRAWALSPDFRPRSLPPPQFPPMPPMNNIMQNDVEIRNPQCPSPKPVGELCMADIMANFCDSDNDCSPNRVCCQDPCSSDFLPIKLCLLPVKITNNAQSDIVAPAQVSAPDNFKPPTTAEPTKEVPATATEISQPPTSALSPANSGPHPSCPKPQEPKPGDKCNEDGTICAVSCASFDDSHTECRDDSMCVPGRICCQDPCPNSKVKLCFPDGTQDNGKLIAEVTKVQR